jgi:hypothetical protein
MKINESSDNINSETSHLMYWSDSPQKGEGSSPFIHSMGEITPPPFDISNGDDRSSKDSRLNSFEKIESKFSPAIVSHCSSQNRSDSLDRDPDRFLDAQESNLSEAASATAEIENGVYVVPSFDTKVHSAEEREIVVKKNGVERVMPAQLLPLPKSPTESWLSRTLPSVSAKKQPVPSFLGMQVQNRKQVLREDEMKPSRSRQIRFSEVILVLITDIIAES